MRKKGDITLENFLGILIAVICLAALTYGIVKVYQTFAAGELTRAKSVLNLIESKQNIIEDDGKLVFSVQSPCTKQICSEWFLLAWNAKSDKSPAKCTYKSCLCMCKKEDSTSKDVEGTPWSIACQVGGVCKKFNYDIISVKSYAPLSEYSEPGTGEGGSFIDTKKENCKLIKFGPQLVELEVSKKNNELIISSSNSQPLTKVECEFSG